MSTILILGNERVAREFSSYLDESHEAVVIELEEPNGDEDYEAPFIAALTGGTYDAVVILPEQFEDEMLIELALFDALEEGIFPESVPVFYNALFMTGTTFSSIFQNRIAVTSISFVPGLTNPAERLEAAPSLQLEKADAERDLALLDSLVTGAIEQVEDRVALVSARVVAMIVNEAAFALMEKVADAADIDTAMKLGTNYPLGPMEWGDRIGLSTIAGILSALHEEYGEERYRPCVLLRQHERAKKSFRAPIDVASN